MANPAVTFESMEPFGPPPFKVGETILVRGEGYKILQVEQLQILYRNMVATGGVPVETMFQTDTYKVEALIPASDTLFYIQRWGINGQVEFAFDSPSGTSHFKGESDLTYFNSVTANYRNPLPIAFPMRFGDVVELRARTVVPRYARVYFYGYRAKVTKLVLTKEQTDAAKVMEDFFYAR